MAGFSGGGVGALTKKKIKNTAIPMKIRCSVCNRDRDRAQFSNKQLETMKFNIASSNPSRYDTMAPPKNYQPKTKPIMVRCRECTGDPVSELQCAMCDKYKDLSQFAKAQRKTPDDAKCLECMEEIAQADDDREPTSYANPYEDFSDDDYGDYLVDDTKTESSGITNPWATYEDGDYVTADDIKSGRYLSEDGSTYQSTSRGSRGGSNLTSANIRAFNKGKKSYGAPSQSSQASSRGQTASEDTSSTKRNLLDSSTIIDSERGYDKPDENSGWQPAKSGRKQATNSDYVLDSRPFNSWGPQGQNATHYRAPSTASSNSAARGKSDRGKSKQRGGRNSNFPKIRPNKSVDDGGFGSNVRQADTGNDAEEYYNLSNASGPIRQDAWSTDKSAW